MLQAYENGSYADPSDNYDLLCDLWRGVTKGCIMELFRKSSEKDVKIVRRPKEGVVVSKVFKPWTLQLVALTNRVNMLCTKPGKEQKVGGKNALMQDCFEHAGGTVKAVAVPQLQYPKADSSSGFASKSQEVFLASYWACKQSFDMQEVNCEKNVKVVTAHVGGKKMEVHVPIFTNTKQLNIGDELIVLKTTGAAAAEEPPNKMAKKGNEKGKAKGKGKQRK
jgi:hypothetical protein